MMQSTTTMSTMLSSPSFVSLEFLVLVIVTFLGYLCIVRVPAEAAPAFYLISFEYLIIFATSAMLVSLLEYCIRAVLVLFELISERSYEKDRAKTAYYTSALKRIEDGDIEKKALFKSSYEVIEKIRLHLDSSSSAAAATTTREVDEGATTTTQEDDKNASSSLPKNHSNVSSEESSICSAAATEI